MTANGSLKMIGTGELPSVVASEAMLLLARGGAQCTVDSTMYGGICWACAKRVPSRETNGGAFLQLLQVPASSICFQCVIVQPVTPVHLHCPSRCIQYTRDDCGGCSVSGNLRNAKEFLQTLWKLHGIWNRVEYLCMYNVLC